MNRLEAYQQLRAKQNRELDSRWEYNITGRVTHPPTAAEPWTAGRMDMTRTERRTRKQVHVAHRTYQESAEERRQARENADKLTAAISAFANFEELTHAKGGYRPSLSRTGAATRLLADYYDAAQVEDADDRRAYRG